MNLFDVICNSIPPKEVQKAIFTVREIHSAFGSVGFNYIGVFSSKSSAGFESEKDFGVRYRHSEDISGQSMQQESSERDASVPDSKSDRIM